MEENEPVDPVEPDTDGDTVDPVDPAQPPPPDLDHPGVGGPIPPAPMPRPFTQTGEPDDDYGTHGDFGEPVTPADPAEPFEPRPSDEPASQGGEF